ncbi:S8 family peptidase [Agarivorans sp. QJM3NY_33]|uniref:S8 family peptidase n=1 Tax=Agarivorans sp. QJM3NY_33 TaxID=3421432 RepID=UPI003D7CC5DB
MKIIVLWLLALSLFACGGGGESNGSSDGNVTEELPSYLLSGTANVLSNTVIDSDVNDFNAPYVTNNTSSTAQQLPPIAVVSGYLTSEATGVADDRFADENDDIDVYKVDLEQGQSIFLEIADWQQGSAANSDFDLALYRVSDLSTEVASSIGVNQTEYLSVDAADSYYVLVTTYTDANQTLSRGNYTLRLIAQNQQSTAAGQYLSTQQDFVNDQIVVKQAQTLARAMTTTDDELSLLSAGPTMSLYQQQSGARVRSLGTSTSAPEVAGFSDNASAEYSAKKRSLLKVKQMAHRLGSDKVTPNYLYRPSALSNDPLVARQWHYQQINLAAAWQAMQGQTMNDVVVAVIDTGMFQSHPDLQAQLSDDGVDFILDSDMSLDGDGIDSNPEDPGDQSGTNGSSSWHGTHVAGTIAAQTDNAIGVAGVAPNVKIMNLRALGYGGGTLYDISQAILYAAGLSNASGLLPKQAASVINMSLGGTSSSSVLNDAVQAAVAQGVIVVAAAGNESSSQASYPAALANVIGVSAVDASQTITSYSNYGSYIDIAAPGGNSSVDLDGDGYGDGVYSTYVNQRGASLTASYQYLNGTSMASPHVAGVVALMKQLNPNLNTADFLNLLASESLSDDIGAVGRDDKYGYGLLNAEKAVQSQIDSSGNISSYLRLSTRQISLSSSESSAEFTVTLVGNSGLSVQSVAKDAGWLTIDSSEADSNGLGRYVVEVSRTDLSDGTYSTTITLSASDGREYPVSLSMTVSKQQADDSGLVYVFLVDPVTENLAYQQQVTMTGGVFPFSFAQVKAGEYRLYVTSDLDRDESICDEGELCGAYPVRNDITSIIVDGNIIGLTLDIEPISSQFSSAQNIAILKE